MILRYFQASTALLLAASPLLVQAQDDNTVLEKVNDKTYQCTFSEATSIHQSGEVLLQHYTNTAEGTYTIRMTYLDGHAWVGIGTNFIDEPWMAPAYAVIGKQQNGQGNVQRYWLDEEYEDGSGVMPYKDINGHLKKSWSFVQTDDDESILEFTHDLVILEEDDQDGTGVTNGNVEYQVTPQSTWVWAIGLPDNQWEGIHRIHGSFQLALSDSCKLQTPATDPPTEAPVMEEAADEESDTEETVEEEEDESANLEDEIEKETEEIEAEKEEEEDEVPAPSQVDAPTPEATTSTVAAATTDSGSTIVFLETASDSSRSLWVAHGILMGIAWGICVPLAIGASVLRKMHARLLQGGTWLHLHSWLMCLAALLTLIGLILAIVATNKDNSGTENTPRHFSEDKHHKVGLAIVILILVQALAGFLRPAPTSTVAARDAKEDPHEEESNPSEPETDSNGDGEIDDDDVSPSQNMNDAVASENGEISASKSSLRQAWEYMHRAMGLILLGLAWYNCHTGIQLQAENYYQDDEERLLSIFWGITGALSGIVIFLGYVVRV